VELLIIVIVLNKLKHAVMPYKNTLVNLFSILVMLKVYKKDLLIEHVVMLNTNVEELLFALESLVYLVITLSITMELKKSIIRISH
jgi:hypothetical protein